MLDEKTIEDLKAKHGEIHLLELESAEVIVKVPDRDAWRRYRDMQRDEKRAAGAPERLLRDCCVFPDAAGLETLLAGRPGLVESFALKCQEIAGLSDKVASRKL
jgi:hypothetical protein